MKAFLLSAFIVIAFVVFALLQKFGVGIQTPFTNEKEDGKTQITASPSPTTAAASPTSTPSLTQTGKYKDGTYTGASIDANYGNVQVSATIVNGKITDVKFLDYPKDRTTSQKINAKAMPILISEAITAQSANVDAVTGASFTSAAFKQSLQSALNKAV